LACARDALARVWDGFEAFERDWCVALVTRAEGAIVEPVERVLDICDRAVGTNSRCLRDLALEHAVDIGLACEIAYRRPAIIRLGSLGGEFAQQQGA
jgi:hypothetical protein